MKRSMLRFLTVLLAACALSAAPAQAQTLLFDYVGFDFEHPDNDPDFGGLGDGYQGVGEVPVLFAPLVFNHATYQYTYHFDGLEAQTRTLVGDFVIIDYTPGTLTIYEDATTPGVYGVNPPNGTAPPSFVDGTEYLVGNLTNFQFVFNSVNNTGSFQADFEAVGGSQIGNLPVNERLGWTFAGATGNSSTIPEGYDHQIDGQTFLLPPTATRSGTWGDIKARYRRSR